MGPGAAPPEVEVVIEIPRGSFLKRSTTGALDFVSPLPCPFNYGSVHAYVGLDGDLLDALVLGPRLPQWTRIRVPAHGAVGLTDRDMYDDKLVCARRAPTASERRRVVLFFHLYARGKRLLNLYRGRRGRTVCEGWGNAAEAIARARRRGPDWSGPDVPF